MAGHVELSTRAGRRFAKPAEGDELIGVVPVGDKDLLGVITEQSHTLICKTEEINELAGPGRGVTVIKVDDDDKVIAFLCTSDKQARLELETTKGRKVELTTFRAEAVTRGGKGHQQVKRDTLKTPSRAAVIQLLPVTEEKK
jgi:DNA gyrase subunit A